MAFDYYERAEKIGIYLAVIAVGYVAWRLLLPYVFSALGRMVGADKAVPLASADLRPGRDEVRAAPVAAAARVTGVGFDRRAVESVGGNWEETARLNAVLAGLAALRQSQVVREGGLRSRVAWKVAVFRQAALHRLVALAAGAAANWNARNVLGAALAARALLEAAALLADFDRRLEALCRDGDLAGIDALVTGRGFATPLDGLPPSGGFDPALIDALAAPDGAARADYDALAGLCDAGALGQYRGFGEFDKAGTAVTFSAEAGYERGLYGHVLGGFGALVPAEASLRAIAEKLPLVAGIETPAG